MDSVKVRVWDKDKKVFFYPSTILNGGNSPAYIHCLFTGHKDKDRKEIYEGDILEQGEGNHITWIEVKYGDGTFDSGCYHFTGFYGVYLKIGFGGGFGPGDLCEDMDEITKDECERRKVIGNIYENPELLNLDKKRGGTA